MSEGWVSKRKYISLNLAFFVAIAAFLATFAVTVLYKPGKPTAADLSLLQAGMTPAQVTGILGEPKINTQSYVVPGNPEETWTYYLAASRWSLKTQTWQLKFYQGRLDSWWKQQ
jgi:outer membrane protein assembly factor BamE (lipoprotein component of BamABCDE complex)